jgi:hypothetical protein
MPKSEAFTARFSASKLILSATSGCKYDDIAASLSCIANRRSSHRRREQTISSADAANPQAPSRGPFRFQETSYGSKGNASTDRLNESAVAALKLLAHRDSHGMLMADRPVWNAWRPHRTLDLHILHIECAPETGAEIGRGYACECLQQYDDAARRKGRGCAATRSRAQLMPYGRHCGSGFRRLRGTLIT